MAALGFSQTAKTTLGWFILFDFFGSFVSLDPMQAPTDTVLEALPGEMVSFWWRI